MLVTTILTLDPSTYILEDMSAMDLGNIQRIRRAQPLLAPPKDVCLLPVRVANRVERVE